MQQTKIIPTKPRISTRVLASQKQRLLDHLKAGRSIHFLQAMQMDIPFLNDRIRELRMRNMNIQAKPIRMGRIACYEYSLLPSNRWQVLRADRYSWARIKVNGEWLIECIHTILGSTRVCLRQEGHVNLLCNWCAGNRRHDILYLINTILGYLEAGEVDLMPMCSRVKPYYQDQAFMAAIRPFHRQYITDIAQVMPAFPAKHSTPSLTA